MIHVHEREKRWSTKKIIGRVPTLQLEGIYMKGRSIVLHIKATK